jgi:ABC-type methionine transport system permease subunit
MIVVLCVLHSFVYVALAASLVVPGLRQSAAYTCFSGFSGILWGLLVLYVESLRVDQLSVFGLFEVPLRAYPFVILILLQLLVPASSFIGHLAGAQHPIMTFSFFTSPHQGWNGL